MKHNSPLNDKANNHSHITPNTHRVNNAMEAILTRNLYYKEQVTNTPAEYYYHVGDVSFDGYRDGVLVDAQGEGLLNYIETNWTASIYGSRGLVDSALRRLEAGRNAGATPPSNGTSPKKTHSTSSSIDRSSESSLPRSSSSTRHPTSISANQHHEERNHDHGMEPRI